MSLPSTPATAPKLLQRTELQRTSLSPAKAEPGLEAKQEAQSNRGQKEEPQWQGAWFSEGEAGLLWLRQGLQLDPADDTEQSQTTGAKEQNAEFFHCACQINNKLPSLDDANCSHTNCSARSTL